MGPTLGFRGGDRAMGRRSRCVAASWLPGSRAPGDHQKAILKAGALDLDVVGERELAPKRPWEIPRCSNRRDPEGIPIAAVATTKKFGRPRKVSRGRRNFFLQGLGSVNPFDPSSSAPALPRARRRGFPRPLSLSTEASSTCNFSLTHRRRARRNEHLPNPVVSHRCF
jgi:hypothetical protein